MKNKTLLVGSLVSLGIGLGIVSDIAVAQISHENMQLSPTKQTNQFRRIEQPLWAKGAVTAGGLSLIVLELWWFLFTVRSRNQKSPLW